MENSHPTGPPQAANSQEEFEKLLSLAEILQEYCETKKRLVFLCRAILSILFLVFVFAGAFIAYQYFLQEHTTSERLFVVLPFLAVSAVSVYTLQSYALRISRRIHSDQKALKRVLQLIHETEGTVAKSEGWSALDQAQFEIRLSRLEIAP